MKREIIKRENGSLRILMHCEGESETRQEFAKETDINTIMKRYEKTGQITHLASRIPWYGDATEITDYKSAWDAVIQAQEAFEELPARIREKFENDPQKLIEALQDPQQEEKLVELGVLEKKSVPSNPQEPGKTSEAPAAEGDKK